jgi:mRNA interferase RelE/StbE
LSSFQIVLTVSARKELRALTKIDRAKIDAALLILSQNPTPPKAIKLTNREGYRVRIGDLRIIYEIQQKALAIKVIKIGYRGDVYRHSRNN